jgi:UDP-GlcNAc:undecaprenyl-phosphate/decaprenyl-phosphate GlcNAc-1-phosphate transferase
MSLLIWPAVVAFLFSLVLTPLVRDGFRKWGFVDRPDNLRKLHVEAVPRVGGVAIALSYLLTLGAFTLFPLSEKLAFPVSLQIRGLIASASVVFFTGLMDDLIGLKPWQKLLGQLAAAMIAFSSGIQIHLLKGQHLELLSFPVTVLWLVACSNAFNLIDGIDGLAAGVGLFATVTTLIAALTHQNTSLVLVTVPLIGCLLGFLRYNFNPASIFLGDSGSLLIGYLLGCYGVLWSQKSATLLGMTAPLMSLAIPLLDTGLSIFRRYLRKQPIFGGDRGHIHHRLLERGFSVRRTALLMYGICALAAAFSLLQNAAANQFGGVIVVLFCGAAWIGIQHLGYAEFGIAKRFFIGGAFRKIIDEHTRLHNFEKNLSSVATLSEVWHTLREGSKEFGFEGIRLNVLNRTFEDMAALTEDSTRWQIRIPLPDSQYVNLYRNFSSDLNPSIIGAFARLIESILQQKLADPALDDMVAVSVQRASTGSVQSDTAAAVSA